MARNKPPAALQETPVLFEMCRPDQDDPARLARRFLDPIHRGALPQYSLGIAAAPRRKSCRPILPRGRDGVRPGGRK
jgi:hypothetical protein